MEDIKFRETGTGETMAEFHVGQIDRRVDQDKIKKIISDHHDLYLFLAASFVEVLTLLFVSVDGVWVTWHFIQKQNNSLAYVIRRN